MNTARPDNRILPTLPEFPGGCFVYREAAWPGTVLNYHRQHLLDETSCHGLAIVLRITGDAEAACLHARRAFGTGFPDRDGESLCRLGFAHPGNDIESILRRYETAAVLPGGTPIPPSLAG